MAATVHKLFCKRGELSIFDLGDELKKKLNADAELLWESDYVLGSVLVLLLTYERFYFRNGSYASLSIMLTEDGETQTADIVGSGGGEGIFNFSMGANASFAKMASELLRSHGFEDAP